MIHWCSLSQELNFLSDEYEFFDHPPPNATKDARIYYTREVGIPLWDDLVCRKQKGLPTSYMYASVTNSGSSIE